MGRNKKEESDKKITIPISIEEVNFELMEEFEVKNRSKFVNWLLQEHFNKIVTK